MEGSLTEEERRRNGRRIDLLFVSSSHPVAPDVFELADLAAAVSSAEERRNIQRIIDPKLTGQSPLLALLGCDFSRLDKFRLIVYRLPRVWLSSCCWTFSSQQITRD